MKKWISLIVIVAAGAWGFQKWHAWSSRVGDPEAGAHVATAMVETRNIHFAVNAAGDIGPADQVSVRPEVNGLLKTLPVDIGDRVRKSDVLFTLDDTDLQTERSSRVIEIEAAKIQLEKAQRDFERSKQLYAAKLISQEVFDDTRTTYELAKNTLAGAEKALHLIEYQLTKTKVLAPFDCTILTRPVSVGQAVSGSGGFNSGTEVMSIANLNDMIVNAHINQADVTRLSAGQGANIQVESVPGLKLTGTVERIAPQATLKNNIKGYDARIILKNIDPRVRPGMTANLSIPVASTDDALAVPLAAVFTEENPDTQQTERFVYVKTSQGYERRLVQVGVTDYDYAEIVKGLKDGDAVALELPPGESLTQLAKGPNGDGHPGSGRGQPGGGKSGAVPGMRSGSTNTAVHASSGSGVTAPGNGGGSSSTTSNAASGSRASDASRPAGAAVAH